MRTPIAAFVALLAAAALPLAATAEPVKINFPFFSSDRSVIYQTSIKPFVDAVNEAGQGVVEIDVSFSNPIAKMQQRQAALIADGTVEMGLVVPALTPDRFHNMGVLELPTLYRDPHEASLIFTRLVADGTLKGYDDYFVVGAFVSAPENIHSRKPIASLADLNGLKIRINNATEAKSLARLGAIPVLLPINQTSDEIARGTIDGAALPPAMVFEFGVGRYTAHHYRLPLGGAPTMVAMNRKLFERLPPAARAIIRNFSGEWLAETSAAGFDAINARIRGELQADPRRHVVVPTAADMEKAREAFAAATEEWAASAPENRALLGKVENELVKLRSEP